MNNNLTKLLSIFTFPVSDSFAHSKSFISLEFEEEEKEVPQRYGNREPHLLVSEGAADRLHLATSSSTLNPTSARTRK